MFWLVLARTNLVLFSGALYVLLIVLVGFWGMVSSLNLICTYLYWCVSDFCVCLFDDCLLIVINLFCICLLLVYWLLIVLGYSFVLDFVAVYCICLC